MTEFALRSALARKRETVHKAVPDVHGRVRILDCPVGIGELAKRRRNGSVLHSSQQNTCQEEDRSEFEFPSVHISKDGEDEWKLAPYTILNNCCERSDCGDLLGRGRPLEVFCDEEGGGAAPCESGEARVR